MFSGSRMYFPSDGGTTASPLVCAAPSLKLIFLEIMDSSLSSGMTYYGAANDFPSGESAAALFFESEACC